MPEKPAAMAPARKTPTTAKVSVSLRPTDSEGSDIETSFATGTAHDAGPSPSRRSPRGRLEACVSGLLSRAGGWQTAQLMAPGDTARLYHRLTSYTPDREWTTPVDDPR